MTTLIDKFLTSQTAVFRLLVGALLWTMNTLVLSARYWLIDSVGVSEVDRPAAGSAGHAGRQQAGPLHGRKAGRASAVGYLFLTFHISTAFSLSKTQCSPIAPSC